jgi:hypothetical protein
MKTLLKRLVLLFALPICALATFPLPASADSTADLILSMQCGDSYNINKATGANLWPRSHLAA